MWVREDKAGGWVRSINLLKINNLYLQEGMTVPTQASAIKETVLELIAACIQDGANPNLSLDKPLSFSAFVRVMEEKGLFTPLSSNPPPGPAQIPVPNPAPPTAGTGSAQPMAGHHLAQPESDAVERELNSVYRSEVKLHFLKNKSCD